MNWQCISNYNHYVTTADPLFMIGAVAVGMFHRADLGIIIAGAHYISCLLVGFILRFYKGDEEKNINIKPLKHKRHKNILAYAVDELIRARKNDGRQLGKLVGDSVRESLNTLLMIGGFIILFSVITKIFIVTGFITALSRILVYILQPLGVSGSVILPLVSGFFEITNGANIASQIQIPLIHQIIITNIVIAWSGLSVFAQVTTMVNGTDINLKPYLFARILQSILAGISTIFLFKIYENTIDPTFNSYAISIIEKYNFMTIPILILIIILALLVLSFIFNWFNKIKIIIFHYHN